MTVLVPASCGRRRHRGFPLILADEGDEIGCAVRCQKVRSASSAVVEPGVAVFG